MTCPRWRAPLALGPLLLLACASSPAQRPDEPLIDERAGQATTPGAPASAPGADDGFGRSAPGTIRRADLLRVLAGSPGQFLAGVDALPEVSGGLFRGWHIRSFFAGDPRVRDVLRPHDLVYRVNDHAIESPDQFAETWRAAGARPDLTVDLRRDGKPLRLSWRIVD